MRTYSPSFSYANSATEKYPRFVVGIIFDTDSLYFTSHLGIPNVPGSVIENVLTVKDARSVRIFPDQGRSDIGVVNFDLLDLNATVTEAFRAKLTGGTGLRGRKVILYHGWKGADFTTFEVFQTQVIQSDSYHRGVYSIHCNDITREQRKDILDPKKTRLTSSISEADTTITVASTAEFYMVDHGDSYEDAPGSIVGYVEIEKEMVRYTGLTPTTFTGCTRGVLNTRAVPHTVDVNTPPDQRTEVKEGIYLQMPVPKLILALLTGILYDQAASLPDHWHLGISEEWVRVSDFTDIGLDLWDQESDITSFVARFLGVGKTDGKKFLETECYMLSGCYPIIYSDGTIGIKRMNRILFDASYVAMLDPTNVESWSELTHDMEALANDYRVEWNFVDGKATRVTGLIDGQSIAMHKAAPRKTLSFRGLYGSRHTDSTVRARLAALRDRYAHPPAVMNVQAMPHLNVLEVGDIIRCRLPLVRDYSIPSGLLDRSMEIQGARINLRTGDVNLDLFGSTGLATTQTPDWDGSGSAPDATPMPDDFYDSQGTDLAAVLDMTLVGDVWVVDAGEYELPGSDHSTDPEAIYYFTGGDLLIPDGVTLNITQNVQLRIMGFLEINGDINGVAAGKNGFADSSGYGTTTYGRRGFGDTRGMNGLAYAGDLARRVLNIGAVTTVGFYKHPAPVLTIVADSSSVTLQGLPFDLRGTSGGAGGKFSYTNGDGVLRLGGAGGDSGAGLIIISRGLSVGASGSINLSGGDTAPTVPYGSGVPGSFLSGAGAPGCPGALLIVLDGQDLSYPDLSGGRLLAITGASGAPMTNTMRNASGGSIDSSSLFASGTNREGFLDPATTDSQDMSNQALQVVYLAAIAEPAEDQPSAVPPPASLSATGVPNGVLLTWDSPDFDLFDGVEVYMATTNDRSGATKVAEVKATSYLQALTPATTRYFWIRNRRADLRSTFEPTGATSGASATSS